MRLIDADVLKQHIDKLPALPDGNFAGNHSALKALINMQPTIEPSTNCSEIPNSSDAINRQDAIDALDKRFDNIPMQLTEEILKLRKDLRELPTIQPEPHEGEWIEISSINHTYKCSECGRLLVNITDGRNNVSKHYPYCHCGAKMRGEKDG